jgi:hypothetical protein
MSIHTPHLTHSFLYTLNICILYKEEEKLRKVKYYQGFIIFLK